MTHLRTIEAVSRNERRCILAAADRARKSGDWGEWEKLTFPRYSVNQVEGWAAEITTAYRNRVFSVLWRDVPGNIVHLAVTSLSEIRPSWPEMQRIKDELAGEGATAVEVYPPRAEIVDQANMYHIWVLPNGLPFSLFARADELRGGG